MERQQLNVFRMRLLGAEVREVAAGTATLKDATSEAIRDWVTNVETTHYILGSAAGPHPYPMMVSCRRLLPCFTRSMLRETLGFSVFTGAFPGSTAQSRCWPLVAMGSRTRRSCVPAMRHALALSHHRRNVFCKLSTALHVHTAMGNPIDRVLQLVASGAVQAQAPDLQAGDWAKGQALCISRQSGQELTSRQLSIISSYQRMSRAALCRYATSSHSSGRRQRRNAAEQRRTCIRSSVDGQCGKRSRPPLQVRDFQAIIGRETKVQCAEAWNGLPDILLACVGGGSNAIGLFHHFVVRCCCSNQLLRCSLSEAEAMGVCLGDGRL